jgi:hypothetical protein
MVHSYDHDEGNHGDSEDDFETLDVVMPEHDTPCYWDIVFMHAVSYADAHAEMDVETCGRVVQTIGSCYGAPGIADLAGILLARVRIIDPTTPGSELVATTRENVYAVRPTSEGRQDITHAPYQIAAVDQIAPILASALDQEHCDSRSLALFLRDRMRGTPRTHVAALTAVAGGMLTCLRRTVVEAHVNSQDR